MSINSINPKASLNPAQRASLNTANEVKQNVLKTAKRFQSLDEAPSDKAQGRDTVLVTEQTDLPNSTGNKLARLAVGILAPKEADAKVTGFSTQDDKGLLKADIQSRGPDGKTSELGYQRLEDGTQIFHGPTNDGYAVVRENRDGTLMILNSEEPALGSFRDAVGWTPAPSENVSTRSAKTFADTLKELASGAQATGIGTNSGPEADKPASEATKPPSGFLAPFGATASDALESAKKTGEKVFEDASGGLKNAGQKMDQMAKESAQAVKDWTQTDTAETIGNVLFGKLNPFKKRS